MVVKRLRAERRASRSGAGAGALRCGGEAVTSLRDRLGITLGWHWDLRSSVIRHEYTAVVACLLNEEKKKTID